MYVCMYIYSIGQKKKKKNFFIIAKNFNEISMASTHIGSDYFPLITVIKVPLVAAKSQFSIKKILWNTKIYEIS